MLGNDEHTKNIGGLCSLIGQVWINERCVQALYGLTVRLQSADAAKLLGQSEDRRGDVQSWAGRVLQHLKTLRNGAGREQKGAAGAHKSRKVIKVVEKVVLSRSSRFRLPACLRFGAQIFPETKLRG